jgi:uncharacterized protein DUF3224
MQQHATGTFEVTVHGQPPFDTTDGVPMGRTTIDKRFQGDLDATSKVEMLSAGSPATGSAGYVAMERVVGRLAGRAGSFVLQHSATMDGALQALAVTVVPGSGARGLTGLTGQMAIEIVDGKHFYKFDYTIITDT